MLPHNLQQASLALLTSALAPAQQVFGRQSVCGVQGLARSFRNFFVALHGFPVSQFPSLATFLLPLLICLVSPLKQQIDRVA